MRRVLIACCVISACHRKNVIYRVDGYVWVCKPCAPHQKTDRCIEKVKGPTLTSIRLTYFLWEQSTRTICAAGPAGILPSFAWRSVRYWLINKWAAKRPKYCRRNLSSLAWEHTDGRRSCWKSLLHTYFDTLSVVGTVSGISRTIKYAQEFCTAGVGLQNHKQPIIYAHKTEATAMNVYIIISHRLCSGCTGTEIWFWIRVCKEREPQCAQTKTEVKILNLCLPASRRCSTLADSPLNNYFAAHHQKHYHARLFQCRCVQNSVQTVLCFSRGAH